MNQEKSEHMAKHKRWCDRQRRSGGCLDCAAEALPDRRYCEKHLALRREWARKRRERARECRGQKN